jgi:hypothetical protein
MIDSSIRIIQSCPQSDAVKGVTSGVLSHTTASGRADRTRHTSTALVETMLVDHELVIRSSCDSGMVSALVKSLLRFLQGFLDT